LKSTFRCLAFCWKVLCARRCWNKNQALHFHSRLVSDSCRSFCFEELKTCKTKARSMDHQLYCNFFVNRCMKSKLRQKKLCYTIQRWNCCPYFQLEQYI
jgi:hypothetical protein